MVQRDQKILRFCAIDRAIRMKAKSQEVIASHVREVVGIEYSTGTVKLDLKRMRDTYGAPIMYDTIKKEYRYSQPYEFSHAFVKYWADYMVLSCELSKLIYK